MGDRHEDTRQRYVDAIQGFAAACGQRLTWEPRRRFEARDEMLRAVLGHAAGSSPWHRARLHGIDIDQITGESTRVLVTHLHNYVQPLIRYEISDRVRWAEPASGCPWRGQWLSPPQGRTDDIFRYGRNETVAVHPHVFRSALLADPAILSYQIRQTTNGADIQVVPAADETIDTVAVSQRVTDDLRRAGLENPLVEVVTVPSLEHHSQSGKLRRFIPLSNHP